jgi:WD40 repeat protein
MPSLLLEGHTGAIRSVAFSPDGRNVASSSVDKTIRLWRSNDGKQEGEPLYGHADIVTNVCFLFDGQSIVSSDADGIIIIWNTDSR